MYRVDPKAPAGPRLISDTKLTPDDFRKIAQDLGMQPFTARKSGLITARTAEHDETVETRWNGKETVNTARPGDRIVTNLDAHGVPLVDRDGNHNVYVVKADKFVTLYELGNTTSPLGQTYRARGTVEAIAFPGGFDILAPWGERQLADNGCLILNGGDVYGNHADTFNASYERLTTP
jgi:hypothetical protein